MHLRERKLKTKELGKIIAISLNDSANDFTLLKPQGKGKRGIKGRQDLPEKFMLEDWAILPCSHYCGLYLEGHRRGDPDSVSWMTSMVENRLDSHHLITVSGQCYQLIGDMVDEGYESALSHKFLTAFHKGFPKNWKYLLLEESQRHKVTQTNGQSADILENVDAWNTHTCQPSFNSRPVTQHCELPTVKKAVSKRNTSKPSQGKENTQETRAEKDNAKTQTKKTKLTKPKQKVPNATENTQTKPASRQRNSANKSNPETDNTEQKVGDGESQGKKKILTQQIRRRSRRSVVMEDLEISQSSDLNVSNADKTGSKNKKQKKTQPEKPPSPSVKKSSNRKSPPKDNKSKSMKAKSLESTILKSIQNSPLPEKVKAKKKEKGVTTVYQDENHSKPCLKKEINLLHKIMKDVDKNSSNFWLEVSVRMGTRSEEECRKFHQTEDKNQEKKPAKKAKENSGEQAKPAVQITANKGTMKRKRQLKEYMENFNAGYEDEYFDSTPFKTKKPLKMPKLDMDNSFKMIADELGGWKSPGVSYVCTPGVKYSGMPTPQVHDQSAITPRIGDADRYVHKILKQRKGRRINKKTNHQETIQEMAENPLPDKMGALFEKKTVNPENVADSDEEFDDYFTET